MSKQVGSQVQVIGGDELIAALTKIGREIPEKTGAALFQVGEEIMALAKEKYVPVDLGPLRASGFVRYDNRFKEITVKLGFGGASAPYALIQHENMNYRHTTGGPKYLERPVMERADSIGKDVAEKVKL